MCLYPKILRNRKYRVTKKNKGNVPKVKDKRVLYVPVGCGKCMECKKQKAKEWQVRLHEDLRKNKNAWFVTYTFSEEGLQEIDDLISEDLTGYERDNEICSIAVRRYTERWRKKHKKALRHWFVTELGKVNTERVHLHGIVWTNEIQDVIDKWQYGNVWVGEYVNEKTINYIVKYVNKVDEKHKEYNSKIYASKGIGANYLERDDWKRNRYSPGETIETYKTREGQELALPIYYRNKIYTDEEKELLWIEKIDKEERFVDGVLVSTRDGTDEYYKLLEYKRLKNKRLGYGDDSKNWDLIRYENDRRRLKRSERIAKLKKKLESEPI